MNKFFTVFEDESIELAIQRHSTGYNSISEAIEDINQVEYPNKVKFKVIQLNYTNVYEGITNE